MAVPIAHSIFDTHTGYDVGLDTMDWAVNDEREFVARDGDGIGWVGDDFDAEEESDSDIVDDMALYYASNEGETEDDTNDGDEVGVDPSAPWTAAHGGEYRGRGYSWDVEVHDGNFVTPNNFMQAVFDIKKLQKVAEDHEGGDYETNEEEYYAGNKPKRQELEGDGHDVDTDMGIHDSAAPTARTQDVKKGGKKVKAEASSSSSATKVSSTPLGDVIPAVKPMRGGYAGPLPLEPHYPDGKVGNYTYAERRAIIEKFREKKRNRIWKKQIKYVCRKKLAETRPRVKGRFVSRTEDTPHANNDEIEGAVSESQSNHAVAAIPAPFNTTGDVAAEADLAEEVKADSLAPIPDVVKALDTEFSVVETPSHAAADKEAVDSGRPPSVAP